MAVAETDWPRLRTVEGQTGLESIAYQHPRYTIGGESKKDHAATEEECEKGKDGHTLCGRPLGRWWFPRGQQPWTGAWSFECSVCRKVALRLGYIELRP